uniref:Uncharacterized protein n=1 Tax=Knipowitschia caucasica TaxID=637954 RepID=A0AAV2L2X7_KNICA
MSTIDFPSRTTAASTQRAFHGDAWCNNAPRRTPTRPAGQTRSHRHTHIHWLHRVDRAQREEPEEKNLRRRALHLISLTWNKFLLRLKI